MTADLTIPDDIMESAKKALNDAVVQFLRNDAYVVIAKAILAERERCWKLANGFAAENGMRHEHDDRGAVVDDVCAAICASIRKGGA